MDVTAVWNGPSVVAAFVAGVLYVPVFWWSFLRMPLNRSRSGYAVLVAVNVLVGTFLQSVSQAIAALYIGDDLWFRIVSRWFLWLPFAAAVAVLLVLRTRRHHP